MKERAELKITGVVQGVGFRPFIYQLAHERGLKGWVLNSSEGVIIDAEGEAKNLKLFTSEIEFKAPPMARIEEILIEDKLPLKNYQNFTIKKSREKEGEFQLISPDIATCDDCLGELFDPADRRYRYPFINCTNCGPRFTIIEDIPYDRPKTTMHAFKMCPQCQAEYDNPTNRRFHAQPNACAKCGPSLELWGRPSKLKEKTLLDFQKIKTADPVAETIKLLKEGEIMAIKGLGGFHLACNATSDKAVTTMRKRKNRRSKPFAIMVADLGSAKKYCHTSPSEAKILELPQRPIVLLKKKPSAIAKSVAPDNNYLGVMLPYTPLHHLILRESKMALVMTSGNISEEPIAMENKEALQRLGGIADYFLMHNRDIYSRYDDSVAQVTGKNMVMVRRARSFAPYPLHLPFKAKQILAVGPELKNTFCLTKDNFAFISQHIGDMENLETLGHFETTLELYKRLFRIKPLVVAYDLHPEYLSTKFAQSLTGVKLIGVQHHHAHIVSCMVENSVRDKVIGVAFDGLGYGPDKAMWGGEFLTCDWAGFERQAHLRYVPMPGGEAAIKKPYRMALSFLYSSLGPGYKDLDLDFLNRINPEEEKLILQQINKKINAPLTSGAGRLFDAVSSLLGIEDEVDYEGQAAVELEMIADESAAGSYPFKISSSNGSQPETRNPSVIDTQPIVAGVIKDLQEKTPPAVIAGKFHNTIVSLTTSICQRLREREKIDKVALSGGVFQNRLLTDKLRKELEKQDFEVLTQKKVPTNDGGVSLGQATIANTICSS